MITRKTNAINRMATLTAMHFIANKKGYHTEDLVAGDGPLKIKKIANKKLNRGMSPSHQTLKTPASLDRRKSEGT